MSRRRSDCASAIQKELQYNLENDDDDYDLDNKNNNNNNNNTLTSFFSRKYTFLIGKWEPSSYSYSWNNNNIEAL